MMRWIYKLPLRLRSLFWKSRVEQELSDELRFHLEKLIEEKVAKGMIPEEARYAALRELGGVEQIKEECRDMRRVNYIENFFQDIRYGLRMLARNPGFTTVAVLRLALGIGANSTFFSIVDGFLLRPLPVRDPDQLTSIYPMPDGSSSYADYLDIRRQSKTFEGIAAVARHGAALNINGETEIVKADFVSGNYFAVLGVVPVLGRTFPSSAETGAGSEPAVVISYGLWQRRFGGAPDTVGKLVRFNGRNAVIVGIAPDWFHGLQRGFWTEVWFDAESWVQREALANRDYRDYELVGRLRQGAPLSQARAEFDTNRAPPLRRVPCKRQRIDSCP
jgi:hypothetical protein